MCDARRGALPRGRSRHLARRLPLTWGRRVEDGGAAARVDLALHAALAAVRAVHEDLGDAVLEVEVDKSGRAAEQGGRLRDSKALRRPSCARRSPLLGEQMTPLGALAALTATPAVAIVAARKAVWRVCLYPNPLREHLHLHPFFYAILLFNDQVEVDARLSLCRRKNG